MAQTQYDWQYYFSQAEIDTAWANNKEMIYRELERTYFMKNPPESYARGVWESQLNTLWRQGADLEFLFERTGRPMMDNLDIKTLTECCKEHLKDCLNRS